MVGLSKAQRAVDRNFFLPVVTVSLPFLMGQYNYCIFMNLYKEQIFLCSVFFHDMHGHKRGKRPKKEDKYFDDLEINSLSVQILSRVIQVILIDTLSSLPGFRSLISPPLSSSAYPFGCSIPDELSAQLCIPCHFPCLINSCSRHVLFLSSS